MIEVSHLTKAYGPRTAIQDLNFSVQEGEIVGFLGPNGAGKTTTMKILTGFMPASSGTAKVAGYDVFENPIEVKRNVGYLPETPPVHMEMTVRDFIEYAARLHDVTSAEVRKAAGTAMEKTGLTHVSGRLIGNLSKGYRQRVGLAQALVHNPKVLVLDEPTVGLDPAQIIEIRELIKGLAGEHTVILSTHILPEVQATCPRVIIISGGRIVAQDELSKLTAKYNAAGNLTIQVQSASSAAADAVKGVKGVQKVTSSGNRLYVDLDAAAGEIRPKVLQAALKAGAEVLEFSSSGAKLEEIFIRLTNPEAVK
ncbi:MAG TPA: ABC transporter ATP-binding protein [Bdellovibrionota bacterium]|jgi:ABC-2 type transport system ATP-binding protein|nr:ABC transporter ATP-binding protein [Bdellovibrionota bacterium]